MIDKSSIIFPCLQYGHNGVWKIKKTHGNTYGGEDIAHSMAILYLRMLVVIIIQIQK